MKFYIENHEGKQVFEGTQVECEAEMNRLVLSGEEGYWRMFDETDHDEAWQEGGLVELAASQQSVRSDGAKGFRVINNLLDNAALLETEH